MPYGFVKSTVLRKRWGGPPWGCPLGHGTPPSRSPSEESGASHYEEADQGVGRPRGRPVGVRRTTYADARGS
jgi:hypothetical protein